MTCSSMEMTVGISLHSLAYLTGVTVSWGSRSTCMCSISRQNEARNSYGNISSDIHLLTEWSPSIKHFKKKKQKKTPNIVVKYYSQKLGHRLKVVSNEVHKKYMQPKVSSKNLLLYVSQFHYTAKNVFTSISNLCQAE